MGSLHQVSAVFSRRRAASACWTPAYPPVNLVFHAVQGGAAPQVEAPLAAPQGESEEEILARVLAESQAAAAGPPAAVPATVGAEESEEEMLARVIAESQAAEEARRRQLEEEEEEMLRKILEVLNGSWGVCRGSGGCCVVFSRCAE